MTFDLETIYHVGAYIGIAASAIYSFLSHRNAKQANDAVNHRHVTGTPRLYDLALRNDERVDEIVEWKRGYEKEGVLDTGDKVSEFMDAFHELEEQVDRLSDREGDEEEELTTPMVLRVLRERREEQVDRLSDREGNEEEEHQ